MNVWHVAPSWWRCIIFTVRHTDRKLGKRSFCRVDARDDLTLHNKTKGTGVLPFNTSFLYHYLWPLTSDPPRCLWSVMWLIWDKGSNTHTHRTTIIIIIIIMITCLTDRDGMMKKVKMREDAEHPRIDPRPIRSIQRSQWAESQDGEKSVYIWEREKWSLTVKRCTETREANDFLSQLRKRERT